MVSRFATCGLATGSKVMRRKPSERADRMMAAVSSSVAPSGMVLPLVLDIFAPSMPCTAGVAGQQGLGFGEDGAVAVVEPSRDQPGQFDVRQLILPHRHESAVLAEDVGGLMHRIGEQQRAHRAAGGERLGLDRGVAVQLGIRDQRQERQHQLIQRRHQRMREDDRAVRVDAGREVLGDQHPNPIAQRAGPVPVGDHLVVGDDNSDGATGFLQPYPVGQSAEVVPEVQRPGRPVAGDDALDRCRPGASRGSASLDGPSMTVMRVVDGDRHDGAPSVVGNRWRWVPTARGSKWLSDPAAHRRPEVWDITDTPSGDPPPGLVRGQGRPGCHG